MKFLSVVLGMILFCGSAFAAEVVFSVDLAYKGEDTFVFKDVELLEGSPPSFLLQPDEGYRAEVTAFDKSELFKFNFTASLKAYDRPRQIAEKPVMLIFPYYNNAKQLGIYSGSRLILAVDLSEYAVCNQDGICDTEINENMKTCREDCEKEAAQELDESVAEEETPEEAVAKPVIRDWMLIAAGALLLLILIIIVKLTRNRQ